MKEWFDSLERRERLTLIIGAVFLTVVLLYVALVQPLFDAAAKGSERIAELRNDIVELQQMRVQIESLGPANGPRRRSGQSMVVIVDQTARRANLRQALKQTRPVDEATVRVRFEAAEFDALVRWMADLQTSGIQIDTANFDRVDTPGLVDAQLTLARPAA